MKFRHRTLPLLVIAAALAAQSPAHADANPFGIFFDNSFDNIEAYQRPHALLVAGNCNRYDARFAAARAAGADVLAYLNPVEVYDTIPCKLNREFYNGGNVALWPFPRPGERINWPKTHMVDIRAGSEWSNHLVDYVEHLMRERKVDGVFLDNIGARLWSNLAQWKTWPPEEQDAWTEGCIDLVRRIDERRRAINPQFIVVTNNVWDRGDPKGFAGEQYIDGAVIEHPAFNLYHQRYAQRPFGNLGHRRVLVMARSAEDAVSWSKTPGVTHVTWQPKYDHPGLPLVPFTDPVR